MTKAPRQKASGHEKGGDSMITRGGLTLNIPESLWNSTFRDYEEQKKAETILQTLGGMSIVSAKELLTKCGRCLDTLVIHSSESQ